MSLPESIQNLVDAAEAALPGQKTPEFTRYAEGLFYASACTSLSDEEATVRMNEMPTGTRGGWAISADKTFTDGSPHPNPCDDNPGTHRHILFEA